jgi:subtilisin family serine protease
MAGPHVAGTVALLLSAQPELIGQVAKIEEQIAFTAVPTQLNTDCGEIPGTSYPNNSTGWGRIDALNTLWYGRYSLLLPWISRD